MTVSTADRIAAAARDLLVAEGAAAVSMRRLADLVGMTPMAIYRHYANRDALMRHVADVAFAELGQRFDRPRSGDLEDRLHQMLDELLDLAVDQPHLYTYLFTEARPGARSLPEQSADSPTLRVVGEALAEGMAEGRFRPGDATRLTLMVAGMVQGLIMLRHVGRVNLADDDFRALCHDSAAVVLDGIRL
jgi:AcrR family transcriptional regulator